MLTVVSVNSFVVEAVIMPIIGLLGLMANGASIFVLTRPQFGKTFHRLLICLSAFDSMFISKYCIMINWALCSRGVPETVDASRRA